MPAQQTHTPPARRMRRKNFWLAATVIATIVYVAAILIWSELGNQPAWLGWAGLIVGGLAVLTSFAVMVMLDEVALRAHVDAWFWGGLSALYIFMMVFLATFVLGGDGKVDAVLSDWASRSASPGHPVALGFKLGVAAALLPLFFGYVVWWTAFWLRRR